MIGTSANPPTVEEAEEFFEAWTASLPTRLEWFRTVALEAGIAMDGDTQSLEPLLDFVVRGVDALDDEPHPPAWYGDIYAAAGWSPFGAALMDGLTAYVTEIYRQRVGGTQTSWALNRDARHGHYLQPMLADPMLGTPWAQVQTSVVRVRRGEAPSRLRDAVESTLGNWEELAGQTDSTEEPLVEVTPDSRNRWQVSFPEDIDERLGDRYADLEDVLAAVDGVTEAIMEDRDRALVRTNHGMDQADLEQRITQAVEALVP